jgi:hypothetical protein
MCASEWDSTRCSSCCFWLWRYQFTSVIDSKWSCVTHNNQVSLAMHTPIRSHRV